ncbi:MAG: hypothetical protein ACLQRH_27640 [Acidimicrobiales bacterium]
MSGGDEWSPDEPMGTETFEQGDDARDESGRVDPRFDEDVDVDPSLDPTLLVDHRELEEVGAELDDPEALAILDGGMDDPDGIGEPASLTRARRDDEGGWNLDAPLLGEDSTRPIRPSEG